LALVALILLVVVGGCALGLDHSSPIDYYRVIDSRTIVVGVGTGPTFWARVVSLTETATKITIGARSLAIPVPSTADQITEVTVVLASDVGDRQVFDAMTGRALPNCTAPIPSLPGLCVEVP